MRLAFQVPQEVGAERTITDGKDMDRPMRTCGEHILGKGGFVVNLIAGARLRHMAFAKCTTHASAAMPIRSQFAQGVLPIARGRKRERKWRLDAQGLLFATYAKNRRAPCSTIAMLAVIFADGYATDAIGHWGK